MVLSAHNLRGHVTGSATGILGVFFSVQPCDSEISDFDDPILVQHEIFRLDIPVDDLVFMQILQPSQNAGNYKHFNIKKYLSTPLRTSSFCLNDTLGLLPACSQWPGIYFPYPGRRSACWRWNCFSTWWGCSFRSWRCAHFSW